MHQLGVEVQRTRLRVFSWRDAEEGEMPEDFEKWLKKQDGDVQKMFGEYTAGLKSALEKERENRKSLEDEVRDLAGKAENGSDMQGRLETLTEKMEAESRKLGFYESAHKAGVGNLKLAYMLAEADDMFDKKGGVDFGVMSEEYPELFSGGGKSPQGDAGSGRGDGQPDGDEGEGMNRYIRAAAGRGSAPR